jgi:hypothetical protein
MNTTALPPLRRSLTVVAAAALVAACADQALLAPESFGPTKVQVATLPQRFSSHHQLQVGEGYDQNQFQGA